jgi:acyl carrier protein
METQVIGERIKGFLAKQFPATKKTGIEESLLRTGLIDSLGILDVVAFLEKEFAITITDEELLPENFDSIRNISNFVQQKTNGKL